MRHRRIAKFSFPDENDGGANLTPLIDIVFVVLVTFILVAPMMEIDKVSLASGPAKETTDAIHPSSLLIHVYEDNSIQINKRTITGHHLAPLLKALYAKNPKLVPQLFQDERAQFGTYQKVKNALEEAGFRQLEVVLSAPSQ